jgi:hypothetical protein
MTTMQREGAGIMARTYTPIRSNIPGLDQRQDTGTHHAIPITVRRKVRRVRLFDRYEYLLIS